jgi:hypothetical protein
MNAFKGIALSSPLNGKQRYDREAGCNACPYGLTGCSVFTLEKRRICPGPAASLSCSEVVTLAVFGQWARFPNERAFYRYAVTHLRPAFPTLSDRAQFNRLQRGSRDAIVAFALFLVEQMQARCCFCK